jgi:hypothetical protein
MFWLLSVFLVLWWPLGCAIPETPLPLHANASKLRGLPLFTVPQSLGKFVVRPGAEFIGHVAECPEIVTAEESQPLQTIKSLQSDGESPIQVIHRFIHAILQARVKTAALRLRRGLHRRYGAFNLSISHVALLGGDLVRVALGVQDRALPVG